VEAVRASLDFGAFTDWLCAPLADGGMNLARAEADAALLQLLRFLELKARTRKTRIGSVTASCVSYLTCASLHRTQAAFKDFDATAFSCSAFLDEVWHALLLRPVLYAAVCAQLTGQLLDHNPGAAAASLAHSAWRTRGARTRASTTASRRRCGATSTSRGATKAASLLAASTRASCAAARRTRRALAPSSSSSRRFMPDSSRWMSHPLTQSSA
jgi:hypothetical protein